MSGEILESQQLQTNFKKTSLSVKLACGAFAGIVGTSLIYPLDIVKTRLQNSDLKTTQIVLDIYKNKGIKGFYRGIFANLIGISPEKAIKLAVNDFVREHYARKINVQESELPLKYGIFAGITAGFCQVIVTNPMEMTKIQMQTKTNTNTWQVVSSLGIFLKIIISGIKGLYRHSLATLMRDVPFSLVFFPTLSLFKSIGRKQEDGSPAFSTVFISGILAGVSIFAYYSARLKGAVHGVLQG
jgi:hypothetical protein